MDYRTRLQNLLRELFQFDSADLDFGIYRVLNQRRTEIDTFIQTGLLDAVKKEFEERVVQIDRVSRTVKGGKRMRFRALVVVR